MLQMMVQCVNAQMRERIGNRISGVCKRLAEETLAILNYTQSDPLIAGSGLPCEEELEMHYCLLHEWKPSSTEGGMRGRLEKQQSASSADCTPPPNLTPTYFFFCVSSAAQLPSLCCVSTMTIAGESRKTACIAAKNEEAPWWARSGMPQ